MGYPASVATVPRSEYDAFSEIYGVWTDTARAARVGLASSGTIHKDVDVWYDPECEVVHYVAAAESLRITCVEFEATQKGSMQSAQATLELRACHRVLRSAPFTRLVATAALSQLPSATSRERWVAFSFKVRPSERVGR